MACHGSYTFKQCTLCIHDLDIYTVGLWLRYFYLIEALRLFIYLFVLSQMSFHI